MTPAVTTLLNLMRDGDRQIEELARKALKGAAPVPEEALQMWIDMIRGRDDDPDGCLLAWRIISHMGSLPPTLIDDLLKLINDDEIEFRVAAVTTLASVFDLSDEALTEIADVTKVFGFFMTIAGAALGGVLIVRYGIMRPLLAGAILVASTNLLFAMLALSDFWAAALKLHDAYRGLGSGLTGRVTGFQYSAELVAERPLFGVGYCRQEL